MGSSHIPGRMAEASASQSMLPLGARSSLAGGAPMRT